MAASYRVKLDYGDHDYMTQVSADTVGHAVLLAHREEKSKPIGVSVAVLVRRPGAETWIKCYVAPAILELL